MPLPSGVRRPIGGGTQMRTPFAGIGRGAPGAVVGGAVSQKTPGLGGLAPPPGGGLVGGGPPPGGSPATQQFGPGNNLIGTQFNPVASERLQGTQGQVNQAQQNVAGFQPGQFQGIGAGTAPGGLDQARENVGQATVGPFAGVGTGAFGPQGDTAAARAGITQDLASLRGGPSRGDLASQTFDLIRERTQPGFEQELRGVGQKAAALGRIGAGLTTSQLGDVTSNRERNLGQLQQGLSLQAAGLERGDLLNTLGASQGVAGQLFGQDIGQAGFQQGLRGEERGERGFFAGQAGQEANRALGRAGMFAGIQGQEFGQEQGLRGEARGERGAEQDFGLRNLGAQQNIAGQLAGFEGQQFGQEQSQRNELRGERGFQTALDQQGIQNRVQQRQLEEALLSGQFGRNLSSQQLLANVGFNPASPANFGNQAGQFSQSFGNQANASNAAAADLIGATFNRGGGQQQPFQQPPPRLPDFQPRQIPAFNPRP